MTGIDYLLDTHFIIGLLKAAPETLAMLEPYQIDAWHCAYSAITRMELLGFPDLSERERS